MLCCCDGNRGLNGQKRQRPDQVRASKDLQIRKRRPITASRVADESADTLKAPGKPQACAVRLTFRSALVYYPLLCCEASHCTGDGARSAVYFGWRASADLKAPASTRRVGRLRCGRYSSAYSQPIPSLLFTPHRPLRLHKCTHRQAPQFYPPPGGVARAPHSPQKSLSKVDGWRQKIGSVEHSERDSSPR